MTDANRDRLLELVGTFARRTVLVVSDFVADVFVSGEISRVSREAPVLILRHRETHLVPGGGANAVNNLVDLGARVLPVAAVGRDEAGRALMTYFRGKRVNVAGVERAAGWATPTKTRYLAGWAHTAGQQVLRVDREPASLAERVRKQIERRAKTLARSADAILFSDYGLGVVTPEMARRVAAARRSGAIATLDSRHNLLGYAGVPLTAATPNEPELEAQYHARIGADQTLLARLGERTRRRMNLDALVVTRGKDGMALFERGKKPHSIPIYGSDEVADVTGAGDTVIATFTLALASGATFLEAARLANYAGGIVVMKQGTATVSRAELEAAVRADATAR
jgi:rfaE bifunctional protein kinase chain/domain